MTTAFKVGDRVRLINFASKEQEHNWQGTGTFIGCKKEKPPYSKAMPEEGWYQVKMEDGRIGGWHLHQLERVSQFKKGDKLRLIKSDGTHRQDKPWMCHFVLADSAHVSFMHGDNGECAGYDTHVFPVSSFELWNKQEVISGPIFKTSQEILDYGRKVHEELAEQYIIPLAQRTHPIVKCAICAKEHTNVNDVGDIIGGCVLDGPVKTDGKQNEEMVIGPCCYPRIMDAIMDLKTPIVTTERKNATTSWMPHDEDGNL